MLDREGRLEVAVHHLLAEDVEHPRARGAAHERLVEGRHRKPGLLRERDALGDGHERAGDDDLVDRLAELTRARRAEVRDPLSHRLEDRPRRLERRRVAADEEGQRPVGRALLAARDGRVEKGDAGFREAARDRARGLGRDRRAVDHDRALRGAVDRARRRRGGPPRPRASRAGTRRRSRTPRRPPPASRRPCAPSSAESVFTFAGVRLVSASANPARARLRAIPVPIVPSPMNPTFSAMAAPC